MLEIGQDRKIAALIASPWVYLLCSTWNIVRRTMKDYMEIALKEAKKANELDEVPVGAVIIKDNKILAKAYNTKKKNNLVICHAEINAIIKACNKINDWRLNDCEMYVTLEPCKMCEEVIKESRISKVHYLIKRTNKLKNNQKSIICKMEKNSEKEYEKLLKSFFNNKRK